MSSKQCSQCGLVNWSSAEACKRCGSLFDVQDTPEAFVQQDSPELWAQQDPQQAWVPNFEVLEPLSPGPVHIFSGAIKLLTGILALEVVAILSSRLLHLIEGETAAMVAVLFIFSGFALLLLTHIWLVIRIFEQSASWGLGTLFVPLVGLFAVAKFWEKTKQRDRVSRSTMRASSSARARVMSPSLIIPVKVIANASRAVLFVSQVDSSQLTSGVAGEASVPNKIFSGSYSSHERSTRDRAAGVSRNVRAEKSA
jgi:hypothetical protein